MALEMKYFVLKPGSKRSDDQYASASRAAMRAYADSIDAVDPSLAASLRGWAQREDRRAAALERGER